MERTITEEAVDRDGYIRMSSAGNCSRQTGYAVLGYPESDPTPVEGRNVMDLGHEAEAILVRRLREEGWEVDLTRWDGGEQLEVRLEDPPRVGHPDGRCRHPELTRNHWALLECKGMNAHQFRRFLKEGFLQSHPQYLDQVAHYGAALESDGLVADPCAAVVAALDRDTGKWGYQRVRWERQLLEARTTELAQAWQTLLRGDLPERDHDGTTWHCSPKYCRWSSLCWASERPASEAPPQGEGTLNARDLPEVDELTAASETWREGKGLESSGKAMQEEAKEAFREVLVRYGAKKLLADGLAATLVTSDRRSWDEKALRRFLTEAQLREAHRVTPSASLRVNGSEEGPAN